MAEIDLYQEDGDDNVEDEDLEIYGGMGSYSSDAELTPLEKLQKHINGDNIFNRSVLARTIMDTLRFVYQKDRSSLYIVLNAICSLGTDPAPPVRAELMEQIPHIAMFLVSMDMAMEFRDYIVILFHRALTESNNQVRKTSQAALLVLLEQELLDLKVLEEEICPVIQELSAADSLDDFRTEAVALMSKMAPLIGRELTERMVLADFARMCSDSLFHVRKVCASNFGEVCSVVGEELTEEILLPRFFSLCDDGVWGVRKACAECFMGVSVVCSSNTRRTHLAPIFVTLLGDASRWVRMAAFQALGPFISTFADSSQTGVYFNEKGVLCYSDPQPPQVPTNSPSQRREAEPKEPLVESSREDKRVEVEDCSTERNSAADERQPPSLQQLVEAVRSPPHEPADIAANSEHPADYNSFQFWRQPLPLLDLDPADLSDVCADAEPTSAADEDVTAIGEGTHSSDSSDVTGSSDDATGSSGDTETITEEDQEVGELVKKLEEAMEDVGSGSGEADSSDVYVLVPGRDDSEPRAESNAEELTSERHLQYNLPTSVLDDGELSGSDDEPLPPQDLVPRELLVQFVSMQEPQRAHTVDTEIVRHCAYSLPAVAYTLGRAHWLCLRPLFHKLARSMQWKVRRCLAACLHELAVILGPERTEADLVPVFDSFLRDIDEVRIGLLQHLADYLRLLSGELRKFYLPQIKDFVINLENKKNWRFRLEFVEQLIGLCDLYAADDVYEHVVPLAVKMARDKIAAVRQTSFRLLAVVIRTLGDCEDTEHRNSLVKDLVEHFALAEQWRDRHGFLETCSWCLEERSLPLELFALELLPAVLAMVADRIPNIRITLARMLQHSLVQLEYFRSSRNPHHGDVLRAMDVLRSDSDRDVRIVMGSYRDEPRPLPSPPPSPPAEVQSGAVRDAELATPEDSSELAP